MRIKYPLLLSLLCCMTAGRAAQPVKNIRCDFSFGMPSDFTLIDNDRNTPSTDNTKYPFAVGTPWLAYYDPTEDNVVAVSTSWYQNEGTSDDWMILPGMEVDGDDDVLSWRARATDNNFRDGYAVYVSTTGTAPTDFDRSAPLFSTAAESAAWTRHRVSLAAYKGKTVHIAFVNNSTDCSCLYVDDIVAGSPVVVGVRSTTSRVVKRGDKIVVRGEAFTDLDETVHGFDINYTFRGKTFRQSLPDAEVAPGKTVAFEFEPGDSIGDSEDTTVCIAATHDGATSTTDMALLRRRNRVVSEELTGTWCGFCVKGTVALAKAKERHPDTFIGIAVHGPDPSQDFLCVPEYASYISGKAMTGIVSYPASITNRSRDLQLDPSYIPDICGAVAGMDIKASVDLDVRSEADGTVDATTRVTTNSGCSDGRYRLSYIITENDVNEPGDKRYRQHNSYAGGGNGEMGGYENLPEWVTDYHFNNVARGVVGDMKGIEGSLPQYVVAGHEYTHNQKITLPTSVLNRDNTEIIALLLDTRTGEIVNADKRSLGKGATGVWMPTVAGCSARHTEYFTLDGRRIADPGKASGIVIERTTENGNVVTRKLTMGI